MTPLRFAGACATLMLLAACTSPPGIEVSQRPTPTRVDHVSRSVRIAPQTPLRASDVAAVRRAVSEFSPAAAVHARIALAGPAPQRAASETSLRRMLVEAGVPPTNIAVSQVPDPAGSGQTEIVLHRYVVTPAVCRNYSLDLNRGSAENPRGLIGCAYDRNLSLMVEDPRDLVRGRSIGPADSERESQAIERYRGDEVKELLKPERLTTK